MDYINKIREDYNVGYNDGTNNLKKLEEAKNRKELLLGSAALITIGTAGTIIATAGLISAPLTLGIIIINPVVALVAGVVFGVLYFRSLYLAIQDDSEEKAKTEGYIKLPSPNDVLTEEEKLDKLYEDFEKSRPKNIYIRQDSNYIPVEKIVPRRKH